MSSAASTAAIAGHRHSKDPHDWKNKLFALAILAGIGGTVIGLIILFA